MPLATILIVENDAIIALRLQKTLGGWGYQTTWAISGEKAVELAQQFTHDLALMDIRLDGQIDGIQTAEQLRDRFSLPSIFLTAFMDDEVLKRARLAEPYGFLIKPVSDRELRSSIEMALYKHQIDQQLRESEERLRLIASHMLDMVSQIDASGQYLYVSPSSFRVLGYPPEDMIGKRLLDFIHPADRDHAQQVFASAFMRGEPYRIEYRRRHASGHYVWLEAIGNPVFAAHGEVVSLVLSSRDISDRKQAELSLHLAYDATIEGWSRALDLRDKETEGHTQRVTQMTIDLARKMGFSEEEIVHIRRGALLHDIGKLGVADAILHKPGPLDEDEWTKMRKHPEQALTMLSPIAYLRPALAIPYSHHEKWDGTGYPHGLSGEQIPLAARIFTVVDVWDAITSDRPYRRAWPRQQAIRYLQDQAGIYFDPKVVEVFLNWMQNESARPPGDPADVYDRNLPPAT